jgi:NAD-dependent SIR2 family protein deacetylase
MEFFKALDGIGHGLIRVGSIASIGIAVMTDVELIEQAARAIQQAQALVITAGAGMGVDSGLPDFRGNEGFWKAYPLYEPLGKSFVDLANADGFLGQPRVAWGFYGHRLNLYRKIQPHAGFGILKRWVESRPGDGFIFTSNVDGQFQVAGFDPLRILECHGSIHALQCVAECGVGVYPAGEVAVEVDLSTMEAQEPLPSCPRCGGLARPNILMFGDWGWDSRISDEQERRLIRWLGGVGGQRLVVIECGAGTAIPTVRSFSERLVRSHEATLVRINLAAPQVPPGQIGLRMKALEALQAIDVALGGL